MKKTIPLSLIAVASIYAAEVELAPIGVESTIITEVSQKAQVSADLADALSKNVPSIDMNRRSGIANDIYIRGQKRDNISIEVDGTKVCGACPNRMDPPSSHILASQIDDIEVIEGPYDVETFGTMSGGIKVKTKKPSKETTGELNLGFGSWGYKKFGATLSGGNDFIRVLVSGSTESSDQYEDGDGKTMAEQVESSSKPYATDSKDIEAYTKKSVMTKAYITTTDDQELRLSYTSNQSDNVLYPNTPMDAKYDDSQIFSAEYNIDNLTDIYKNVNLQFYRSTVDHPMDNDFRTAPGGMVMTHHLTTEMKGLKLKNSFDLNGQKLLVGLDKSERTWDGKYTTSTGAMAFHNRKSIDNAVTKNKAIFAKLEKSFGALDITAGARYDSTKITSDNSNHNQQDNKYSALNANIFTSYNLDKDNKIFFGIGQAYRVPDARELYYISQTGAGIGNEFGTPNLKQTKNQEIDFGYELSNDMMNFKAKAFYSKLKDYIYYNSSLSTNRFTNIDAKIYGVEINTEYFATDDIIIDAGLAYKKGTKENTTGDKNLPDIAPLRGNIGITYEYMNNSTISAELQTSKKWSNYDADSSEQEIGSWSIVNLKAKHAVNKSLDLSIGVNNIFDRTYALSNTYNDITLVTLGGDTLLLNEPGRYVYTNLTFRF